MSRSRSTLFFAAVALAVLALGVGSAASSPSRAAAPAAAQTNLIFKYSHLPERSIAEVTLTDGIQSYQGEVVSAGLGSTGALRSFSLTPQRGTFSITSAPGSPLDATVNLFVVPSGTSITGKAVTPSGTALTVQVGANGQPQAVDGDFTIPMSSLGAKPPKAKPKPKKKRVCKAPGRESRSST
jgi:hypothetical protein